MWAGVSCSPVWEEAIPRENSPSVFSPKVDRNKPQPTLRLNCIASELTTCCSLGTISASDSDITRVREHLFQSAHPPSYQDVFLGSRPTLASLEPFIQYLAFISGEALLK